ncbi:MAG: DUF5916 domain-containing protein [Pseudohongiellaceae bacterium]
MSIQLQRSLLFCLFVLSTSAFSQSDLPQLVQIDHSDADITLDGFIDEDVWKDLPVIDGMKVIDPDTLEDAPYETHIRFFYTERGLYVSSMNFQPKDTLIPRMTSRDQFLPRDGFVVSIDASGEGLYGYFLRLNLGGTLTDATVLAERQFNRQWNGAWDGRTQELENGWSAEMFIPWSMMALPQVASGDSSKRVMGLYFERQIGHMSGNQIANPPLPRTVNEYLSAFTKYEYQGIEPARQLTYFPFIGGVFDSLRNDTQLKVGADIFWRPTTNTQLTTTINPDFGSVAADDVVVNLTAFEVFFREQRQFFLEGQDVFLTHPRNTNPGGPGGPISMLNTRRIGGAPLFDIPDDVDTVPTDVSRPSELLGAAKFTGQSGNLRYGVLAASEENSQIRGTRDDGTVVDINADGRDFWVGRLLYEDTSSGGRRSIGWMGTDVSHSSIDATVNGIDAHYFSADNRLIFDGQLFHSDVDGVTGMGGMADFRYRPGQGKQHTFRTTYFDDTLDINDLGFLTRNDQMNLDYNYNLVESDIEGLRNRNTTYILTNQWNTDGRPVRMGLFFNQDYNFLNNDTFRFSLRHFPKRADDRLGRGTGDFEIPARSGLNFSYETDPSKKLSVSGGIELGQDALGPARYNYDAGVQWRPNDRFSANLNTRYTDSEAILVHRGDGAYTSFEGHQWSPNLELNYFISNWQQLRLSVQWNALKAFEDRFWQVDPNEFRALRSVANPDNEPDDFVVSRMTFQARYRWELAPLSDLFLVYTRGSNLPSDGFDTFSNLLEQSFNDRVVDTVAFRLRYRFGS